MDWSISQIADTLREVNTRSTTSLVKDNKSDDNTVLHNITVLSTDDVDDDDVDDDVDDTAGGFI